MGHCMWLLFWICKWTSADVSFWYVIRLCGCVRSWFLWKLSSRLSLFLDGDVSTSSCGSTGSSGPGPGGGPGPGPRPGRGSRCSSRCSSCSRCRSAQYGGDLSLHEGPRGTVGRGIQRTALSAGAVHLPITPSALNVHSGAGEAEPVPWH